MTSCRILNVSVVYDIDISGSFHMHSYAHIQVIVLIHVSLYRENKWTGGNGILTHILIKTKHGKPLIHRRYCRLNANKTSDSLGMYHSGQLPNNKTLKYTNVSWCYFDDWDLNGLYGKTLHIKMVYYNLIGSYPNLTVNKSQTFMISPSSEWPLTTHTCIILMYTIQDSFRSNMFPSLTS